MKVAFYTLGCKVNTYESEALTNLLEEKGFSLTFDDVNVLYQLDQFFVL